MIGGNFNARTGVLGRGKEGGEEEEIERRSRDRKVNIEGRKVEKLRRGESVIDYVVGEEKVRERVISLEVGDCIESDHHLLIVELKGKGGKKRRGAKGIGEGRKGR